MLTTLPDCVPGNTQVNPSDVMSSTLDAFFDISLPCLPHC